MNEAKIHKRATWHEAILLQRRPRYGIALCGRTVSNERLATRNIDVTCRTCRQMSDEAQILGLAKTLARLVDDDRTLSLVRRMGEKR